MSFDKMDNRHRRKVRPDGTVVDLLDAIGTHEVEVGRVVGLTPLTVHLRTGETVKVDGYLRTAGRPPNNVDVMVIRKGSFVLLIGEVVLL